MKNASNSRGEALSSAVNSVVSDAKRGERDGISRRQVLARSAVAAGVVWAAPVIKTASAYALTASGTERPCTGFYVVGLTLEENYFPPYPYGFWPPLKKNIASGSPGGSGSGSGGTGSSGPGSPKNNRNKNRNKKNGSGDNTGGNGDGYGNWDTDAPKIIVPPLIATWGRDNRTVPVLEPDVYPQITQTGAHGWAVLLPEVTGPNAGGRQPRFILGYSYQGTHFAYGFVDPNPANPLLKGRRLLFPSPVGNDHEGDDINGGGNGHGRNNSTSTSSTSSTTTTSTTTPGSTTTTTTTRPRHGGDGNNGGGNPFGPPSPTTTSSTTTTSTTTTTMPPPPPSTTTSTSTTSTTTSTTTTTTLPPVTTTTRPPPVTTTTRPKNNQEHGRNSTTTSTTTRPPATTTTTRPPVTTSSTTTTTSPGSSTTTTSTTSPGGTTTTTSDDPWTRWLAAGGPDNRGGGSGGDGRPNESNGGGDSAPKLKPFIDTGVGAAGPAGPEVDDAPERAHTRRFKDFFDSGVDGRPVRGAPIKGVVLIYCKP